MPIFAIIKDGIVVNTIIGPNQEIIDQVIAATTSNSIAINLEENNQRVGIGFSYENDVFSPPEPEIES
jgi:hypothetical protein